MCCWTRLSVGVQGTDKIAGTVADVLDVSYRWDAATDKVLHTVAHVLSEQNCWDTAAEKVLRTVAGILDVIYWSRCGKYN
jgi:hypothetical protein